MENAVREAAGPLVRRTSLDPFTRIPRWMRRIPMLRPAADIAIDGRVESTLQAFTSLAGLLKAGRPLSSAIGLLAGQGQSSDSSPWRSIRRSVQAGIPLSSALREHPHLFPDYLCEAIAAGEESGRLGEVLEELSTVLRDRGDASQQVVGSMVYPFIILGLVCVLGTFVTTIIMPKFAQIYVRHGVELPYSTQALLRIGEAHREIRTVACLLVLLGATLAHLILRRGWFKQPVDAIKLCIPVYRHIHGQELLGWFCSLVAVLMRGGIPVPRALQLAAHASPNGVFASFAHEVVEKVASGIPLTEAVNACPVIPLDARHILAAGEEGNILAESFQSVGQLYRTRLLRELRSIVALVEPAAIIGLGILVAWFVHGAYRPIFLMSKTVSGQ